VKIIAPVHAIMPVLPHVLTPVQEVAVVLVLMRVIILAQPDALAHANQHVSCLAFLGVMQQCGWEASHHRGNYA
jgi:hypothetical protein